MATVAYGSLPFAEQIAFFRAKKLVPTTSYLDVWESAHDGAFMVAGANRVDLVADFQQALQKVVDGGATLEEFRKDFDTIVDRYGWTYNGGRNWRTRVIYETNLRQSYHAGRRQQLLELSGVRPFWRYRHSDAVEHPRPIHQGWDGLVLRFDHPFWQTHSPMNGWGCQCYIEALNERDLKRLGKNGPDQAPPIEMQTVIVGQRSPGGPRAVQTPLGIDPGFGYAPGRGGAAPAVQTALAKTERLSAAPAAANAQVVLDRPRLTKALDDGYADWQRQVRKARKANGERYIAGAVHPGVAQRIAGSYSKSITAAIEVRDSDLVGWRATPAFGAADLARLPAMLRSPLAIFFDQVAGRLLYLVATNAARGRGRAVVSIAVSEAGANRFVTAGAVDLPALQADVIAGRLSIVDGELD
ncbi:phage head morphogenesis protein [Lysobacter sp. CA199]|uniref:phage head morphogenesis protein n=1 Tax=Lysobacter sp. CA199 TaxID=3455608 RepID=UPI003F8D61E4